MFCLSMIFLQINRATKKFKILVDSYVPDQITEQKGSNDSSLCTSSALTKRDAIKGRTSCGRKLSHQICMENP